METNTTHNNAQRVYFRQSPKYGQLLEASAEVWIEFEPADEHTEDYLDTILRVYNIESERPSTNKKLIYCLSDFFSAKASATNNLICWPMGNDHFVGAAYSRDIASRVRDTLIRIELIELAQKSSKLDKLAAIYKIDTRKWGHLSNLKFKPHGIGPSVQVRSAKIRKDGKIIGGKKMSRRNFPEQFKKAAERLKPIDDIMLTYPLENESGRLYAKCRRVFNNGKFENGGRLYGNWQNAPEEDRLKMTIGGEPVSEIDIKASYLNICNGLFGDGSALSPDPYQDIRFVRRANDPEQRKTMRKLAKLLVSAYISNGHNTTQFPKGESRRTDNGRKTVSVREKFNLPRKAKASDYYKDITDAFPFLLATNADVFEIMYKESEAIIDAILELAALGIPTYPVHDSLMCRQVDEDTVVASLQKSMLKHFGVVPALDVSRINEEPKIFIYRKDLQSQKGYVSGKKEDHNNIIDDQDYEVLEDFQ